MIDSSSAAVFPAPDYDLAATLNSGQAFRWHGASDAWTGVVLDRWVRLRSRAGEIHAETAEPVAEWSWLRGYLQLETDFARILAAFPDDPPLRRAVATCRGLRLLRQPPWECLASFILSSTKQIVQIRQIVALLCRRFGEPVAVPPGEPAAYGFPSPARLAGVDEAALRECKMGFRASYLRAAAEAVASGRVDLAGVQRMPLAGARAALTSLPGVGPKIANCVLLFAYDFPTAFPVDVWVLKALRRLYFPRRRPTHRRLHRFAETHFGPHAGYAQQYLFHYMRTVRDETAAIETT